MKWKFTSRVFSLLLGIVVALIIVLTLWLKPVFAESENISRKFTPKVSTTSPKAFLKKILVSNYSSL